LPTGYADEGELVLRPMARKGGGRGGKETAHRYGWITSR
jgi:hypothetical protein